MTRKLLLFFAALLICRSAFGITSSQVLLARAWPFDPQAKVTEIGRGVGLVFSPDLSVDGNCRFYQSLGFACFQDADWTRVLAGIHAYNVQHPERRLRTLVFETHGTNGNGLKLQRSYDPKAERSYIAVGALQERLEPDGIRYLILSACNSGRLLRPSVYKAIDRNNGDKLFLPATCGIVDASPDWTPRASRVTVITPVDSHIEQTLVGSVRELAPVTRKALADSAKSQRIAAPKQFAVSEILMQMLLRSDVLQVSSGGYVEELSKELTPVNRGEGLFHSFVSYLNSLAGREHPALRHIPAVKRASTR